jgi:hypothetical protein
MAVEGTTTARVFEAYVKRLLAPALRPGQVVVMDTTLEHTALEHTGQGGSGSSSRGEGL